MRHKNQHRENVESRPQLILEQLKLQSINIAHTNGSHTCVICPEKRKCWNSPEVNEKWRRANHVRAELLGVAKTKLELVNGHESKEHDPGDGKVQHANTLILDQCQFHIPSTFETNKNMQQ